MGFKIKVRKKLPSTDKVIKSVRKELSKEMVKHLRKHIELREKLVSEWSNENQPTFKPVISHSGDKTIVRLKLTGAKDANGASISVYRMISGPKDEPNKVRTSVRHAVMNYPYRPQTRYKSFSSSPKGNNRRVLLSKNVQLPGVEYRRWDEAAYEQLERDRDRRIKKSLIRGFNNAK